MSPKAAHFAPALAFCLISFLTACGGGGGDSEPVSNQPPVAATPPTAAFTATPSAGVAPLSVTFDAGSSSDSDGTIVDYSWNFGDGTTGNGNQVTHTYGSTPDFRSSDYAVVLTVRDNSGREGTVAHHVTVTAPAVVPPNQTPVARIAAAPSSGNAPLVVSFNASASTDADGTITSYSWSFGDGQSGVGETTQHSYASEGTYVAVLTVVDDGGAQGQADQTITVTATQNQSHTVGGTVVGLQGTGLVLQNNGGDDAAIDADGAFTFPGSLNSGAAYVVTVKTQPGDPAQTCSVGNGSGSIAGADVDNVTVTCTLNTYTVGGIVVGLTGTGLVLQNNGADDLAIDANGEFTFVTPLDSGAAYDVTIKTPSSGPATCSVADGSGTVAAEDITNVTVTCETLFAYVANATDGTVSAYSVNTDTGSLTAIGSPAPAGSEVRYVAVDPTNRFVYASNSGSVWAYAIDTSTGELASVGPPVNAGFSCSSIAVEPTGRYLYISCSETNRIYAYAIDASTGALTSIGPYVSSTGNGSKFIAVDPTGRFVYHVNWRSNNISVYRIDATTGALTSVGAPVGSGIEPTTIAIEPTGKWLYVTNRGDRGIATFAIDATTGALTHLGSQYAPSLVDFITVEPTGKFAYVTGLQSAAGYIYSYAIDAVTGALTAIGEGTRGGHNIVSLGVDPSGRFLFQPGNNYSSGPQYITTFTINASSGEVTNVGQSLASGRNQLAIATTH